MKNLPVRRRSNPLKAAMFGVAVCTAQSALAFKIDTSPEWDVNFDNSIQYTTGWRAQQMDSRIGNNVVFHQGDYKFPDRGDMVTNRVQNLMELQAVYKQKMGARVTASMWKDFAYDDETKGNPAMLAAAPGTFQQYSSGHYNSYVNRYFREGAEFLDAFVFMNTEVAEKPVYVKFGKLSQYWGNSFFFGFSNIAYSQAPVDYIKGFTQPGSEVKELFLPRKQISLSTDLSPELSITGQYFFGFEPNRYPEGSTYLGFFDVLFNGPDRTLGMGNKGLDLPPEANGNYGIKVNWSPSWAGGDMGFYYRRLDEVHPWLALLKVDPAQPSGLSLHNPFAQHVSLIGFSYEKSFGLISTGFEINQRRNTALLTQGFALANEGAKGTITNVIGNMFVQLGTNALWDSGILLAEFSYTHLNKVTANRAIFNGESSTCAKLDGCATKNALAFAMLFEPQWLQVFPGIDLSMPMSYTLGASGNPAYQAGTFYNEGTNLYSIGVKATYQSKTTLSLQYNGYKWHAGNQGDNGLGMPTYTTNNGAIGINDRGWVQMTLKTSF